MRNRPFCTFLLFVFVLASAIFLFPQAQLPVSDPQAVTLAAQSMAVLTGGASINDVTLTGSGTWTVGDDSENGPAVLSAVGTGESRMDLSLPSGTRTEIRDASTGIAQGKWVVQSGASGNVASHNCQSDAVWFFPAFSSLAGRANLVLLYIGQETRNGVNVQHLQSYVYQSGGLNSELSTMDFYLDAATLLPSAITFKTHPDTDATTDILVEIEYSNYQAVNGALVPMHVQRYFQGTLTVDLILTAVTFNTGINLSNFNVN
jgi:hypothetical protein